MLVQRTEKLGPFQTNYMWIKICNGIRPNKTDYLTRIYIYNWFKRGKTCCQLTKYPLTVDETSQTPGSYASIARSRSSILNSRSLCSSCSLYSWILSLFPSVVTSPLSWRCQHYEELSFVHPTIGHFNHYETFIVALNSSGFALLPPELSSCRRNHQYFD